VSATLDSPRLAVPVGERDHTYGLATAPVTLVEYGDYQCPYCGAAAPVVAELLDVAAELVLFAYRHFPLSQIHEFAFGAALAAEAAGAQGAFWPMHELLFANQRRLALPDLIGYAEALRLDTARFTHDVENRRGAPKIREDFIGGVRSGVNGTPTFFVNGVRHNGPNDLRSLLAEVEYAAAA
jgi:protein-disulfide isomerase